MIADPAYCSVCEVRKTSICAELGADDMKIVANTMAHHSVREGQAIVKQGEPNEKLYVIVSGTFRLVRMLSDGRRQITGFLFPGDFLGLNASHDSVHSAEALEPGLVCRFSHSYLDEMSRKYPGIKDRLLARGHTEMNKAEDHIVLLGKTNAEERVLSFLSMIAKKCPKYDSGRIFLPMPRQDIADYLGLRLETLSRTLASLKKQHRLQEVSGRYVVVGAHFEGVEI